MHRDSLGTSLAIRPGELNWMTAGRGIAHSERTPAEARTTANRAVFATSCLEGNFGLDGPDVSRVAIITREMQS